MYIELRDLTKIEIESYDAEFANFKTKTATPFETFKQLTDKNLSVVRVCEDDDTVLATYTNKHVESFTFDGEFTQYNFTVLDDVTRRVTDLEIAVDNILEILLG